MNRGLPARDTWCRPVEVARALSYSFHSESVTAAGQAAHVHKCSVRIFEQLFNHSFRFFAVWQLRVDQVIVAIVSPENSTPTERRRIISIRITFSRIRVDKDWSALGVRF